MFLLFSSCSSIKKADLHRKNPVEYIFEANAIQVRNIISKEFAHRKYRDMRLYQKGVGEGMVEYEPLKKPENELDFLLVPSPGYAIGYSELYTKGLKGLPYIATFHLHLVELDSSHTKVEIRTLDPEVVVGKSFFPTLPHFGMGSRRKSVEPTTIEEYEILYCIGTALNLNMPTVKYPAKWTDI